MMKFSKLNCCPFCGSDDEYYTTSYVRGTVKYHVRFDGKDAHNEEMYDNLTYTINERVFCANCEKYLGDIKKDIAGKEAEKAFKAKNKK